ncbi:LuxR C-terminal-related transcriptional regulator [Sphingomonas sp. AX6]|uniref:LuxR C-terminal-related transcriptional regulator n=1 Tax=Sphingomonas sp. AX6 TaxID=2653171 RepID=UPI00135B5042|nr:LuxR C-terminal-related transcriptional regulator [Sphingomonas sp. AX6]
MAEQSSQAMAIFGSDLKPIYLNPTARQHLGLAMGGSPAEQLAPFRAQFRSASVPNFPTPLVLLRDGEWAGEMLVLRDDVAGWSILLDARVMPVREKEKTVGFAVIAHKKFAVVSHNVRPRLTRREAEVLDALLAGGTSKVIGQKLKISHRTVEAHRASIMRKCGVKTLPDLFRMTMQRDGR